MFTLEITTDDDAVRQTPSAEIAEILRDTANRVESGITYSIIVDENGNSIGQFNLG